MKSFRIYFMLFIVLALFASCSGGGATPDAASVELRVSYRGAAVANTARNLMPTEIPGVESYEVTLTRVADGKPTEDSKSYRSSVTDGVIMLDNVRIGSYAVIVEGLDTKGNTVMMGAPANSALLDVSITGTNSIEIIMQLISEGGYMGSASMTFDWKALSEAENSKGMKEATEKGTIQFGVQYRNADGSWSEMITSGNVPAGETRYTFTADKLPVSGGLTLRYGLYIDGTLVNYSLTTTVAQIFSGLDSVRSEIFYISASDIDTALNVYNVSYTPGDDGTSVTVNWDNQVSTSSGAIFDYVTVTLTGGTADITQKVNIGASDKKSSCTLNGLDPAVQYTLKIKAHHISGIESDWYTHPDKIQAKIAVQSIAIDTSSIPESINPGTTFTLSAVVTPSNATNTNIIWSSSDSTVVRAESGIFEALAVGTVTVKAVSADDSTKTDSKSITVTLASPTGVTASADANAINIAWTAAAGASSYDIYRSEGADYTKIGSSTETTYSDSAIAAGKSYTYKVMSIADKAEYNSPQSSATEAVSVKTGTIVIIQPTLGDKLVLNIKEPDQMVLLPDTEMLTVSIDALDGVTSYEWAVNGEAVKKGSADEGGTFVNITKDTAGIKQGVENAVNTLMLTVVKGGKSYSAETSFAVVNKLATAVELTAPKETRLSNKTSDGNKRTVQLSAKATGGSLDTVTYESSDASIATVAADGRVTFEGGYGSVTITVYAAYTKNVSKSVTFDVYTASITSHLSLLTAVNNELRPHFKAADDSFKKDWWAGSSKYYPSKNATPICIRSSSGASQSAGDITMTGLVRNDSTLGQITMNGKLGLYADAQGLAGYLGSDDPLLNIGAAGNATMTVSLPYNQGTATISLSGINVIDNTGTYTVVFDSVIGFNESPVSGSSAISNNADLDLL